MSLELLKKKIQAAVPEIMELDFGTQVCFNHDPQPHYIKSLYVGKEIMVEITGLGGEFNISLFKIIGRPIRLADVLATIGNAFYMVNGHGDIGKLSMVDGSFDYKAKWNLTDDNLDHQSPETIQFLCELLLTLK